jgi:Gpi18-like mannosyltransferase
MPISAHPFDMYIWYHTTSTIVSGELAATDFFPPLQGSFFLIPISYIYNWLSHSISLGAAGPISMDLIPHSLDFYPEAGIQVIPGLLFNFLVKLPNFVSDILVTILLYKIVLKMSNQTILAEKTAFLWFLNPFVIWISAGWGMWDSISVLFSFACFYFLMQKRYISASICLFAGVLTKFYPIVFLVPILFFILRDSKGLELRKNVLKFYSVFLIALTILISLSYKSFFAFCSDWLAPNVSFAANAATNPTLYPLGYGLTYWSFSGILRILDLSISINLVTVLTLLSAILMVVLIVFVYWRTSKLMFENKFFELSIAFVLCLCALFLSLRVIPEQFLVWLLPFLILLIFSSKMKCGYYWILSIIALLYSISNCPLPYFFLPLYPWASYGLTIFVGFIGYIDTIRLIALIVLGCMFSAVVLIFLSRLRCYCKAVERIRKPED